MLSVKQKLKLLGFSAGVFLCHCIFGVIQERIFKIKYENEENSQFFSFPVTFVALQCAFYSLFGLGELC